MESNCSHITTKFIVCHCQNDPPQTQGKCYFLFKRLVDNNSIVGVATAEIKIITDLKYQCQGRLNSNDSQLNLKSCHDIVEVILKI